MKAAILADGLACDAEPAKAVALDPVPIRRFLDRSTKAVSRERVTPLSTLHPQR
jgi:hypothetical protein